MVDPFEKDAVLFEFLDPFDVVMEDTCEEAVVLLGCRKSCGWIVVDPFEKAAVLFDFLDALGVIVEDTREEGLVLLVLFGCLEASGCISRIDRPQFI